MYFRIYQVGLIFGFHLALASIALSQSYVHDHLGTNPNDRFGLSVANLGDVDSDGCGDYAISSPQENSSSSIPGQVHVYSGKTRSLLYTLTGSSSSEQFGYSLACAGDVDLDGVPDLIVGSNYDNTAGVQAGAARVFSGVSGNLLYSVFGSSSGDRFGCAVDGLGDINGDGHSDFVVGSFLASGNTFASGLARVFSGADGSPLFTVSGTDSHAQFGHALDGTGDANGDGVNDFIVGAPGAGNPAFAGALTGAAHVISGLDGSFIRSFYGNNSFGHFGFSVCGLGDNDLDGVEDFLVGSPFTLIYSLQNGSSLGAAACFSGATGNILYSYRSDFLVQELGYAVENIGDFNGDNIQDFAIGAPSSRGPQGEQRGSTRIYSGRDGTILRILNGTKSNGQLGYSIAGIEDLNGDNLSDVLCGAPSQLTLAASAGQATVYYGNRLVPMYGNSFSHAFGWNVANAGDVNCDGFPDSIVSALHDSSGAALAGSVRITSGKDGQVLGIVQGDNSGKLGHAIDGLGDINGDGHADFLASYQTNSLGGVRVFSGSDGSILLQLFGDSAADNFGHSAANAGDVDQDGTNDLIVGSPGANSGAGKAQVYSGATGALMYVFSGTAANESCGFSVASAGDVDQDGHADLIVGIPGNSAAGIDGGCARVYSGIDGQLIHESFGSSSSDFFGHTVSKAGDVDNDGFGDFMVTALFADGQSPQSGQVTVFSGRDGTIVHKKNGISQLEHFGWAISDAGDVNGDGFGDFVIGVHNDSIYYPAAGRAVIYSGKDGATIKTIRGDRAHQSLGDSVRCAGDVNKDGFDDIIVGGAGHNENGIQSGMAEIIISDNVPVLRYESEQADTEISLHWIPAIDINSTEGTLFSIGATPGAAGTIAVSFKQDHQIVFNSAILVSTEPTDLYLTENFGFGYSGEKGFAQVSRRNVALAGSQVHIQVFEMAPIFRSSNGIRLDIVP